MLVNILDGYPTSSSLMKLYYIYMGWETRDDNSQTLLNARSTLFEINWNIGNITGYLTEFLSWTIYFECGHFPVYVS